MRLPSISTLKSYINECEQKYGLATQVHQFVWHSITHNFAFPISYYGINNITAHSLNTLIFSLAAKLECIGVHIVLRSVNPSIRQSADLSDP